MPKISVITPTVRPEGLEIVAKSLQNQTFDGSWEWLICTSQPLHVLEPFRTTLPAEMLVEIYDSHEGGFWTLNRAYNDLFRRAHGELIVSLQDWVWVTPEGLEKFWLAYEQTDKKACISGVGDQYSQPGTFGKPTVKVWQDPRKTDKYGSFYECNDNDIEWNWAAIPKQAILEAGGMDEALDFLGYGGDQLQLMERIQELGYKSYLDQANESFTLRHSREKHGGEANWNAHHVLHNGAYDKRKEELKQSGTWPRLPYLAA